jgi:asparagine synthase (glutamine-hydrolysing)
LTAIAGFWSFSGEPARDQCARMIRAQQSYGIRSDLSDDGPYACGLRLYGTVPEDSFDQQPLHRGPYRLVADVRLDNRPELASAVGLPTARFARLADADLLFECLLKWGPSAAEKLIGEFAFALWNEADRTLLLGRDLFGHRPLHFHRGPDFFAFASMPSGLHALPRIPRDFDHEAMTEELAFLSPLGARTHFRGIERVKPGHLVKVTNDRLTATPYWQPPRPDKQRRNSTDYEEGLRAVVDVAVQSQLRGAGEAVGCQLSGGLDSSIVTTTAARQFEAGKVIALTAAPKRGFAGPVPGGTLADESGLAAQTASLYPNVEHVIVKESAESLISVLDRQFAFMQQPTSGVCNSLWAREISRTAKARNLKVVLVGFSGNLTASYSGREAWSSLLVRGRLLETLRIGFGMARKGIAARTLAAQLIGPLLPRPVWAVACRLYGRPTDLGAHTAVNPRLRKLIERKARAEGLDLLYQPSNDPFQHRLHALFDGDNGNYFKGMLAEFGLSFRDPLSDKRVVEYCLEVPAEEYLRGGTERGLARRAFADRLPPAVANLHMRGYQGADWYETIARDMPLLRDELARIERCSAAAEALDPEWLARALDTLPSSGWNRRDVILRYRYGLLRGISAGHFMRKIAGTN